MATGTVYLDVDDEITSAAARIRGSEATKVALVIPYGSRIATSRMNFRLLSREAVVNNRRLSIVATDPATRALAASAGLPVFASVAEWDAAAPVSGDTSVGATTGADASTGEAGAAIVAAAVIAQPPPTGSRSRKKAPVPDEAPTLGLPAAAVAAAGTASAAASGSAVGATPKAAAPPAKLPSGTPPPVRTTPVGDRTSVVRTRSMPRIGGPAIVIAAAVVLAIVVAGVGAYVFLPSAEIVVTPREEPVSIALVIRADPDVAAPDATANVVPADRLEIPVTASDTFPATDKRVEEKQASGEVEFRSFNTASENTIAKGSVVSTEGGIRFQTTAAVTLPRAVVIPPNEIRPSVRTVGIVAAKAGTAGNVPANAVTVIPPAEDPTLTDVRNPGETTGGTHEEFPRISQEDVDSAMTSLQSQLAEEFNTALTDGAGASSDVTVFAETAVLGEATPTPDPATLVGKEQESFELALNATGTVIAVDASPVVNIAETRLLANIGPDHRLVEGSIEILPGDPTVANGEVSFPVTAEAARVRILDPAELLTLVQGQSIADARTHPWRIRCRRDHALARLGVGDPGDRLQGDARDRRPDRPGG